MTAQTILLISGSVVVVCQLAKGVGLHGRWGLLTAALSSAAATALWTWSQGAITRASAWDLFAGFVAVLANAAGVFNLVSKTPEQITTLRQAVTGPAK